MIEKVKPCVLNTLGKVARIEKESQNSVLARHLAAMANLDERRKQLMISNVGNYRAKKFVDQYSEIERLRTRQRVEGNKQRKELIIFNRKRIPLS